jgi:hypothetical protein
MEVRQMKKSLIVILTVLLFGLLNLAAGSAKDIKSLVGHWRMTKMTGKDADDSIVHVEFFFYADSSFKAIATKKDGATDKKKGTFSVDPAKKMLKMTVEGHIPINAKYELKEGFLVIHDPTIDAQVWLEKAAEKKKKESD